MNVQLSLIVTTDAQPDWENDKTTRTIGREGLKQARAALEAARAHLVDDDQLPEAHLGADDRG